MVSMVQTVPMFVDTAKMTELVTNIVDSVLWDVQRDLQIPCVYR